MTTDITNNKKTDGKPVNILNSTNKSLAPKNKKIKLEEEETKQMEKIERGYLTNKELEKKVHERTHELEELTYKSIVQAEQLAKLKDDFVFIATHELRAPVTIIRGNLDILLEDPIMNNLSKDSKQSFEDLQTASSRLQNLVSDLLDVARIEFKAIKIEYDRVELRAVILDSIKEVSSFAKQNNITIEVGDLVCLDSFKMIGDAAKLKDIFVNLLTNAVKYNKPNGKIFVTADLSKKIAQVKVADTGIGLSTEEKDKLFTKFYRAPSSKEGTGLGLWIVKQLVDRMHGEIKVKSKKGGGSTFIVRFF